MNLSDYENITEINEFNYLATPTREVRSTDNLYLKHNGKMIYLGTYGEARTRSQDENSMMDQVIDKDGTNYGSFDDQSIYENLFILNPLKNLTIKIPTKKGGKTRRSYRKKSRSRKPYSRKSYRKKSRSRKPYSRKSHRKKSRRR
jgi:hypothetical protein